MPIELPHRIAGSPGRRRGLDLPTAADVPQARVAADPGVRVPDFGRFAGGVGEGLSDFAQGIQRAGERQRKRNDATRTAEAELAHERSIMDEFRRRQTEDDPSRPDFMADFETFVAKREGEALTGLDDVSEDARERLRIRLTGFRNRVVDSAGRLQIAAGQKRAVDSITGLTNRWAAQASQNPDFLPDLLDEADGRLVEFDGTLTPDTERDTRAATRETIIRSGIEGLVAQKRYDDAEAALNDEAYIEDLPRATRSALQTKIRSARSAGDKIERARVNDLIQADIASRAATGEGVSELTEDRIRSAAGGGEEGDFAVEQYRERKGLADAAYSANLSLRSASPEEGVAIVSGAMPQAGDPDFDDKAKLASALKAEWQRQVELRQSDPATAAMQIPEIAGMFAEVEDGSPEFVAALRQRMAVQRDLGVISPRLLQKGQAKRMVEAIDAASPDEKFASFVRLREAYGPLYPTLIRELGLKAYGGLDMNMGMVAGLTDNPALAREYLTAVSTVDETKKGLGRGEATDIEARVRDGLAPLYAAATAGNMDPGNIARVDGIASGVTALAIQRMRQGKSLSEAADSAVEDLIESRYHMADTWFAPRSIEGRPVDIGRVEVAMEQARTEAALRAFNISPFRSFGTDPGEEARTDAVISAAVSRGFWVTNETQTGAYLAFTRSDGLLVSFRNAEGERYEIDFRDPPETERPLRRGTSGDIRRRSREMFR